MSRKNRKDNKKAKKTMAAKENKNTNLTQEDLQEAKETSSAGEQAADPEEVVENPECTQAAESGEPVNEEPAEDNQSIDGEQPEDEPEGEEEPDNPETKESGEDRPKRERKLKWARSGGAEKKAAPNPIQEKLNEINDRYARLFAEFDNFRKRSDKEKMQRYDFGVKDAVEKILPIIDNFERGLSAVPQEQAEDSFVTGMQMIYKQLIKALEDLGVKPIEAVGQEFNPDFHNAVMHVDDPEVGDNIIVEEFQKGYMYKDHVVRYSMVKVAN